MTDANKGWAEKVWEEWLEWSVTKSENIRERKIAAHCKELREALKETIGIVKASSCPQGPLSDDEVPQTKILNKRPGDYE